MSERWFRDVYRDAVWESETLTAVEKAVAETYARHARDERGEKSASANHSWLTYPRIMAKAGIGRRANVSAAVAGLVTAGWLVVVRESSRRPTLYRLAIPAGSSAAGTTTASDDRSSNPGTTVVPQGTPRSSASAPGSSDGGTQPLRPLEDQPSISLAHEHADRLARVARRERDQDSSDPKTQDPRHRLVMRHGATTEEAPRVVADIQAEHTVRHNGWWHTVDRQGDLGDIVAQALTRVRATASAQQASRPPHCGECDPSRLVWVRTTNGRTAMTPCPTCHQRGAPLPAGAMIVDGPETQPVIKNTAAEPPPACGRPGCRGGWYRLGINKVRCHVCPDAQQQETECAS